MAPTKRKTARGEHRMDAAFDALLPMGFRKTAIRKKVLELLEVYGKPDGWIFIEEASYKLLIESLLGGEEESEPVPSSLTHEVENENSFLGDAGSSSAAGPSNANLISALDMVDSENNDDSNQDSAITSTDGISCCKQENEHTPPPPPPESEFVPPPPPPPPPPPESEFVPPPPPPPVEDMAREPLKAKRKPCYGWWGEETDIVYLPLMKVRQHRPSQGPA